VISWFLQHLLFSNAKCNVYRCVSGLSQHLAGSEEEALGLLFEGEANRAIAEHQLNKVRGCTAVECSPRIA
jgi:hypothetical protein